MKVTKETPSGSVRSRNLPPPVSGPRTSLKTKLVYLKTTKWNEELA